MPTAALFTADAFRSRILGFSIGTGARLFHQTTQTFVILLHTEEEVLCPHLFFCENYIFIATVQSPPVWEGAIP